MLCGYGCGQEAKYPPKKGTRHWCCSESHHKCPTSIKKKKQIASSYKRKPLSEEHKKKLSILAKIRWNDKNSIYNSSDFRTSVSKSSKKNWKDPKYRIKQTISRTGLKRSNKFKKEQSKRFLGHIGYNKRTISYIKKKYSLFSKIEEIRYNPDKPGEKEIQVHCKNHNCPNSKEKNGWFTPTGSQLYGRMSAVERPSGFEEQHLYCSSNCKQECPLYNLKSDPYSAKTQLNYTQEEYQLFREEVLNRSDNKCEYCDEEATHVHHSRPQKLEPFFSLDPDYGISCCKKCHYEKGHKNECSTGQIASKICTS